MCAIDEQRLCADVCACVRVFGESGEKVGKSTSGGVLTVSGL